MINLLLDDSADTRLRARAADELASLPLDRFVMCSAVFALAEAAEDGDTTVQAAARVALDRIGDSFQTSVDARMGVLRSFGPRPSIQSSEVPLLVRLLRDRDAGVRCATAILLKEAFEYRRGPGLASAEELIEQLAETLGDSDVTVRQRAAQALAEIRGQIRADLQRLQADPCLLSRIYDIVWAIDAFRRFAEPFLAAATADPDSLVSAAATEALLPCPGEYERSGLVPDLTRLSTHKDVSVRYESVIALGRIFDRCDGAERRQVIMALRAAMNDTNEDVRIEAATAIEVTSTD